MSASSVYDVVTVPGGCVGESGVKGDTVGEIGDARVPSFVVMDACSVFHHLLLSCLPDSLRGDSFVPRGLVIWPSQNSPCRVRDARAEENDDGDKSV